MTHPQGAATVLVLAAAFLTCLFGRLIASDEAIPPPETVAGVDLNRYVGVWYEIARIPNRFQKRCACDTTAAYSLAKNGDIVVVNRCRDRNGKPVMAKGIAKVTDPGTNARLKVSFVKLLGVNLFWGDYWIIGLDREYRYAVVGSRKRKYGWILARETRIDPAQREEIFHLLQEKGYDPERFEFSCQSHSPAATNPESDR